MVVYLRKSIHSLLSVFKKKAGPKGNEDHKRLSVHYTASQHYQENVFIEGSRPQYLEDLHTEAQEGLKILQQEEHKKGVTFPSDDTIASPNTLCPQQDVSSKDRDASPESRSTAGNTDITVASSVSTRPVLTRQGSTFKPLNPVKRIDKSKKRSRRTTIMGIPNQVHKELALHRSSPFQQLPDHNKSASESQSGVVIIPTVDGGTPTANKEGARVHLSELEASRDEKLLKKHLQTIKQNEHHFNFQGFGSHLCPASMLRPKSVAVPGMTTSCSTPSQMLNFLQEPQGPVMSVSPQATYLSTIIPNAVLPASIEVIEIDHGSSRTHGSSVSHSGSVRTVSKSSLASGDSSVSPLLSRRSDNDGSQTDISHNTSTLMLPSASGSNLSETQSSKTIISNASPTPSKGSMYGANSQQVGLRGQDIQPEQNGEDQGLIRLRSSVSSPNSTSDHFSAGQDVTLQSGAAAEDTKNKSNFAFLSVVKTKQPPAPPQRTNSLHSNKIKRNTGLLVDSKTLNVPMSGEVGTATENNTGTDEIKTVAADDSRIQSPVSNTGSSETDNVIQVSTKEDGGNQPQSESSGSPHKTPSDGGKFERTMSPSSGYSSQSGTPTLSPKGISPTSPDKHKKTPVKPERSVSRASSSAASPSSSLTSLSCGTPEPVSQDLSICTSTVPTAPATESAPCSNSATLRAEIKDLLNIPPPPKVKAPCPPPPETWAHNRHTFELLCESYAHVSNKAIRQTQDSIMKQAGTQTEPSEELPVEKHTTTDKLEVESPESKDVQPQTRLTTVPVIQVVSAEKKDCPGTKHETALVWNRVEVGTDVQREEQTSDSVVSDTEMLPKKDPPLVMKKPLIGTSRDTAVQAEQLVEEQQKGKCSSASTEVYSPIENQNEVMDKNEIKSIQTLSVNVPKVNKDSPPPTPPPAYHPTPPLSRKTPPSSVSMPLTDLQRVQEEIQVSECCWPPPPPPWEGDSVFEGGDEIDFPPPPPPPPPLATDTVQDVIVIVKNTVPISPPVNVGETIVHLSDAESCEHKPGNLPPAVPQPVADSKPEVVKEVSKVTFDEFSGRPVLNTASNNGSPPPPETRNLQSLNRPENPASPSASHSSLNIEGQTASESPINVLPPITAPEAPPAPVENLTSAVNFRRQPNVANRDIRSKDLLSRHKSAPIPKEDANIPLVTPSLLQMVRLRSVNVTEDQMNTPSEDKSTNEGLQVQENNPVLNPGSQSIPQKPIRKSLTLKSPPQAVKTSSVMHNTPSMRLQEAIRMKTAAMSSRDGLPSRLGMKTSTYSCLSEPGTLSLKSPEGCDMLKSPASTASFIFSRSTKKVVIDTPAALSTEAQTSLKQSLAAELMQFSDQPKGFSNGGIKSDKVPPPVAKKPAPGSNSPSQSFPTCTVKMDLSVTGNGTMATVQHTLPETTTRVTADTIETLF